MSTFTGTPNGRGCEAAKGSGTVFVGSQKNYKKYTEKGKRKGRERGKCISTTPATNSSWDIVDQAGFPTSSQMDILLEFVQSFEQHNYPDINLEEGNSHNMASIRAGSSQK
jgi:hypothetical protein